MLFRQFPTFNLGLAHYGSRPFNFSKHHICNNTADQCSQCKRKFAFYRRQVCTIIINIIRSTCVAALISCNAFSCSSYKCQRCLVRVCDSCSKRRVPIPDETSKPERVCDRCFDDLTAQRKKESKASFEVTTVSPNSRNL